MQPPDSNATANASSASLQLVSQQESYFAHTNQEEEEEEEVAVVVVESEEGLQQQQQLITGDEIVAKYQESHVENQAEEGDLDDGDNGDIRNIMDSSKDEIPASGTIKDVQQQINQQHLFGIKIWKPALYKKSRSIDFESFAALHTAPTQSTSLLSFGNVAWSLVFGWWIALVYFCIPLLILMPVAVIGKLGFLTLKLLLGCPTGFDRIGSGCGGGIGVRGGRVGGKRSSSSTRHYRQRFVYCTSSRIIDTSIHTVVSFLLDLIKCWEYAKILFNLAGYMLWPFGKFISKRIDVAKVSTESTEVPTASPLVAVSSVADNTRTPSSIIAQALQEHHQDIPTAQRSSMESNNTNTSSEWNNQDEEEGSSSETSFLLHNRSRSGSLDDAVHGCTSSLDSSSPLHLKSSSLSYVSSWTSFISNLNFSKIIFTLLVTLILAPIHLLVTVICFFCVFSGKNNMLDDVSA